RGGGLVEAAADRDHPARAAVARAVAQPVAGPRHRRRAAGRAGRTPRRALRGPVRPRPPPQTAARPPPPPRRAPSRGGPAGAPPAVAPRRAAEPAWTEQPDGLGPADPTHEHVRVDRLAAERIALALTGLPLPPAGS